MTSHSTFTDAAETLKGQGFIADGQDGCLNHFFKHPNGNTAMAGRYMWGGYRTVISEPHSIKGAA